MLPVPVIINKSHQLMDDQVRILNEEFGESGWERFDVPSKGWTLEEQMNKGSELIETADIVVFASPIPYLLKLVASKISVECYVLHNDNREKKELPNGKIIMTVAKEGWQIV